MMLRVVMLGDIVGQVGLAAAIGQIPVLRQRHRPHLLLANAENAANGSGLTPEQYRKLREAGIDGVTLGDHVYKKAQIVRCLETESTLIRPANLPAGAVGRTWMRLQPTAQEGDPADGPLPEVFVTTVLGRVFASLPADDPFAAADRVLSQLPVIKPIVLVEIHAEATSEKQAMGWYLDGRVAAVLGTHTHVATADARVLPKGTAYITDLGMTGPHESVLGRRIDRVLKHMTTAMHAPFDVADGDLRVCGVMVRIDTDTRRAVAIERIEIPVGG
jgi:2',3'-cyclic-nucleotide 2'-phosphodiesterase